MLVFLARGDVSQKRQEAPEVVSSDQGRAAPSEDDGVILEGLEIPSFLRRPANPMFGDSADKSRPAGSVDGPTQANTAGLEDGSVSDLPVWVSAVDWEAWGDGLARGDLSRIPAWIVKDLRKLARAPQVLKLAAKYGLDPRALALAAAAVAQPENPHAGRVARHLMRGKGKSLPAEMTGLMAVATDANLYS